MELAFLTLESVRLLKLQQKMLKDVRRAMCNVEQNLSYDKAGDTGECDAINPGKNVEQLGSLLIKKARTKTCIHMVVVWNESAFAILIAAHQYLNKAMHAHSTKLFVTETGNSVKL